MVSVMFAMQVRIYEEAAKRHAWAYVHRSGSIRPYLYETKEEAWRMLEMCYPDLSREDLRVVETDDNGED